MHEIANIAEGCRESGWQCQYPGPSKQDPDSDVPKRLEQGGLSTDITANIDDESRLGDERLLPSHIAPQEWKNHKASIIKYYVDEGRTLNEVMEIMARNHLFSATRPQWKSQFGEWGLRRPTGKQDLEQSERQGPLQDDRNFRQFARREIGRGRSRSRASKDLDLPPDSRLNESESNLGYGGALERRSETSMPSENEEEDEQTWSGIEPSTATRHQYDQDSPDEYELDLDQRARGGFGRSGRIILLGDGTEVLTDLDDTDVFDHSEEEKDAEDQIKKGTPDTTDVESARSERRVEGYSEAEVDKTLGQGRPERRNYQACDRCRQLKVG
jgi:hypothetical protein